MGGEQPQNQNRTMNTEEGSPRWIADAWISGDPAAVRDEIARLGIEGAIAHNLALAKEQSGWGGLTAEGLREAFEALTK